MTYNSLIIIVGIILFGCILWNLYVSIQIVTYLNENNIESKIAHQRGRIFKFLPLYKKISFEKTGKVGKLYNSFILSFVLYIIFLLIGILLVAF